MLFASAQVVEGNNIKNEKDRIPTTLAEAHAELEHNLSPEELAKIDAMTSEENMIGYHFGLGMGIRNSWGLWGDSLLMKHMQKLGFTHPDDMSAVILETFWCKRHGKDYRIKERADKYAMYWKRIRKKKEEEKTRVGKAKLTMRSMMMGLQIRNRDIPSIRMPDRTTHSIRARFLSLHNGGVFIAVRKTIGRDDDDFLTEGYFFDPANRRIHKIQVPEVTVVHSAVATNQTAWFAGVSEGTIVLLGIKGKKRINVTLPHDDKPPQLGLHKQNLLVVYPNGVYKLVGETWERIYSGDLCLPRSGPPPELYGNMLFFRDEGSGESFKRLWWLSIGNTPKLTCMDRDMNIVGSQGPRWENSFSYAVTDKGALWACVGEGYARKSLLRRSKHGNYSIAIMNNSTVFTPNLFGSRDSDQGLSVSAITLLQDGVIILIGDAGLYRLNENQLTQELAFTNTHQKISINDGKNSYHWTWSPSKVVQIDGGAYFISGNFGGIYLLSSDDENKWKFESLDEELGKPLIW